MTYVILTKPYEVVVIFNYPHLQKKVRCCEIKQFSQVHRNSWAERGFEPRQPGPSTGNLNHRAILSIKN